MVIPCHRILNCTIRRRFGEDSESIRDGYFKALLPDELCRPYRKGRSAEFDPLRNITKNQIESDMYYFFSFLLRDVSVETTLNLRRAGVVSFYANTNLGR
jgi:hypothetical protein